ncbi:MAG: trypsin-like peptidase domain-containing protein [Bacteroidetes bacterium]|nr:trypsin-like peptidase domain-containing protein [Bacteroidota bacterium]
MRPRYLIVIAIYIVILSQTRSNAQSHALLRTIPTEAQILDENNKSIGKTPFSFENITKFPFKIKVFASGYDTTYLEIGNLKNHNSIFSESLLFCHPCKINTIPFLESKSIESNATLVLRKSSIEREDLLMVAIDTPQYQLPADALFGSVNGTKKKRNDDDISRTTGFLHNIDRQVLVEFERAGINASFFEVKKNDNVLLYNPKIILKPIIKQVNFKLKGKLLRDYTGPCEIKCDWQVSLISAPKEVLATIPIHSSFYRSPGNYELIVHQLLWESERDLTEIDSLVPYLARLEKQYLDLSKPAIIDIKQPIPLNYLNSKEMIKEASKAVVIVEQTDGYGSGFFISPEGYIVTNYHVVASEKDIKVKLQNGEKLPAELVQVNKDFDLALLKVKTLNPVCLEFSLTSDIGDDMLAIGTPLGKNLGQTITKGIVSGYRIFNGVKLIQTDVSINEGSSGGPLLNDSGKVLGIATMKAKGAGIEGIGFGIPSNIILEKLNIRFQ